jgi:hypothetical protein
VKSTSSTIPPEIRQAIVRHVGAAFADRWRAQKDESPDQPLAAVAGHDVHEGNVRERDHPIHT